MNFPYDPYDDDITTPDITIAWNARKARLAQETPMTQSSAVQPKPNESKALDAESDHHELKSSAAPWMPTELKAFDAEPIQDDTRNYQAYDFTMEALGPMLTAIQTVKNEKRSILGYVAKVDDLQKEWQRIYSENCKILYQNLKFLNCSSCDEGPSRTRNAAFNSMRRIKALNRKQDPLGITERTLKEAEEDFLHFEDRFLDLHEESGCKGLAGVREAIAHLRAQQKKPKDPTLLDKRRLTPAVPLQSASVPRNPPPFERRLSTPAVPFQIASAPKAPSQTRTSNTTEPLANPVAKWVDPPASLRENKKKANLPIQHKIIPKNVPVLKNANMSAPNSEPRPSDGSYLQYNFKMGPLSAVQSLKEKDDELVKATWVGMYKEANRIWMHNMTCPECKKAPGDSPMKHKFTGKSAFYKYGRIMNAFHDADPNTLTQDDLNAFVRAMYVMEDMYLDDNWDAKCRGFLGLKERIEGYRERI